MRIDKYLNSLPILETLALSKDNIINFHWADWANTAMHFKSLLSNNTDIRTRYLRNLEQQIDKHKDIKVWLNHNNRVSVLNLYDVYTSLTAGPLKSFWEQYGDQATISIGSENGPFQSFNSRRWIVINEYRLYVYKKILTTYLPLRRFRVGLDLDIKCQFGDEHNTINLKTHKLTDRGISLIVNENSLKRLEQASKAQIELPIKLFNKVLKQDSILSFLKDNSLFKNINEKDKSKHFFKIKQLEFWGGADFESTNCYGIFIPYSALYSSDHKLDASVSLKSFSEKLKFELSHQISDDNALDLMKNSIAA